LPWFALVSRSLFFLLAQALIALSLALSGAASAWEEAARWWIFFPILANLASIALLVVAFRLEGRRYLEILRISRQNVKTDLLWLVASSLIGLPLAAAPMNLLGATIFGDANIPIEMLFRPLPGWALLVGLLFPLTIGLAELPTYFGYAMPRLFNQRSPGWGWLAFLIAAAFLGLQHCFLPFIADWGFIAWRGLMYLPFALYAGLMIKLRPGLLPYFVVIHTLMDLSVLAVYLMP
jgi:hypothetical protein